MRSNWPPSYREPGIAILSSACNQTLRARGFYHRCVSLPMYVLDLDGDGEMISTASGSTIMAPMKKDSTTIEIGFTTTETIIGEEIQ